MNDTWATVLLLILLLWIVYKKKRIIIKKKELPPAYTFTSTHINILTKVVWLSSNNINNNRQKLIGKHISDGISFHFFSEYFAFLLSEYETIQKKIIVQDRTQKLTKSKFNKSLARNICLFWSLRVFFSSSVLFYFMANLTCMKMHGLFFRIRKKKSCATDSLKIDYSTLMYEHCVFFSKYAHFRILIQVA